MALEASSPAPAPPPIPPLTVWYDGGCPLCLREIALMRRLDRRQAIRFVDVAAPESLCPLDRATLLARFHAQEAGQPVVSGAAAFAAMWRAIPLLAPLGQMARLPPLLWLLERAYLSFLRVRPRLQAWMR
jgi:predicted DCC family thiol-disulfide oxidoreductase YuxK